MIGQFALILWLFLMPAGAAAEPEGPTLAEQIALLDALSPSLVRVEYTLQYDKGEAPEVRGCIQRCPNCGSYHVNGAENVVRDERPLEAAGFMLSATMVMTADPLAHPRFIKGIAVRSAKGLAKAEIASYAKGQNAIVLKLAEPLPEAKPLAFDASKKGPYLAITYQQLNGEWAANAAPLSLKLTTTQSGRRFLAMPSQCLVVTKDGTPVGACMKEQIPCDESWKGSPEQWPNLSAAEMAAALKTLEERCGKCLLRVTLNFRSPKAEEGPSYRSYRGRGDDEENATERNVTGLLLDEKRVLVLAQLPAKVTARLERITVHPATGQGVAAKFAHTLTDYGALVATLDQPLEGAVTLCKQPISDFRDTFLFSADITMQGEARVAYFGHERISGFGTGWKNRIYPELPGGGEDLFLFDAGMALAALPVSRRDKVTVREEWSWNQAAIMPAAYVQEAVSDLPKQADANNVPLSEEEESRVAWMGVEMQALNRDLARANNVSDRTRDGEIGGLVTLVHPGSPAAAAGVEPGDILLRLHVEGQPKPLEVRLDDDRYGGFDSFPWDQLSDVPAEYFENLPKPWPSVENSFTLALTDLGFGKKYTAEFFRDGKLLTKEFEVVVSPPHFGSAPKHKSEPLGLTVRNLTFEVRRYFQKKDDDLGVIVSKIEPGGKAAVAGLVPYEIITHVNDSPVASVGDFERLIKDQKQLRLSVNRKAKGRIVKIDMTTATRPAGKGLMGRLRSGFGRSGASAAQVEPDDADGDAPEVEDQTEDGAERESEAAPARGAPRDE